MFYDVRDISAILLIGHVSFVAVYYHFSLHPMTEPLHNIYI